MNQTDKLMLNEGFVFFAFGFAVNGHQGLACISAILAVFTAVQSHSAVLLRKKGILLAGLYVLELLMIDMTHLNEVLPSIALISFASLTAGILWMDSSEKAIGWVMKKMTFLMFVFFGLAFSLHHLFLGLTYTCLLTALLFLPAVLGYGWKEMKYAFRRKHQNSRNKIPAVE